MSERCSDNTGALHISRHVDECRTNVGRWSGSWSGTVRSRTLTLRVLFCAVQTAAGNTAESMWSGARTKPLVLFLKKTTKTSVQLCELSNTTSEKKKIAATVLA